MKNDLVREKVDVRLKTPLRQAMTLYIQRIERISGHRPTTSDVVHRALKELFLREGDLIKDAAGNVTFGSNECVRVKFPAIHPRENISRDSEAGRIHTRPARRTASKTDLQADNRK